MSSYQPGPTGWPPPPPRLNGYELQLGSILGQLLDRSDRTIMVLERIEIGVRDLSTTLKIIQSVPPPLPPSSPSHVTRTAHDRLRSTADFLQLVQTILQIVIPFFRTTLWPWLALAGMAIYRALQ
jgi:hypothetical protein